MSRAKWTGSRMCVASAWCLALAGMPAGPPVAATPLHAVGCDYDGDRFDDLAVGVPGESIGGTPDVGAVQVLYGTASGLTATDDELWHQGVGGVPGANESGDRFGEATGCGDFDGDGFDDLAVGAPSEAVGSTADAGLVTVLPGSAAGVGTVGAEDFTQGDSGGATEGRERFGAALAVGDFSGDGFDDLAIGAPAEKVGSTDDDKLEGAVSVLYGSGAGLLTRRAQLWHQDTPGVGGVAEPRDLFGASLAAGDFDGDGVDDLAVGVPAENVGDIGDAGAVNVLLGSPSGLTATGDQVLTQDTAGVQGGPEEFDQLGFAVAAGDFDADGQDDLAVGAPGEDVGSRDEAGAVNVLYGTGSGLGTAGDDLWHQGTTGVAGDAEAHDRFGTALVAATFDAGARADLAIGAPWDSVSGEREIGVANVLYGSASGLTAIGDQFWHQAVGGVVGQAEPRDWFGETLGAGDFDGDRFSELVAGAPGDSIGGITDIGVVNVLPGADGGLTADGDQLWHQDIAGVASDAEPYDRLSGRLRSDGVYRVPYDDGTDVRVSGNRMTHSPQERIDMRSVGGGDTIVAARAGEIRFIVDDNEEPTDDNNYVWIAHSNGEWTKYTHFEQGSVEEAGRFVGEDVSAGTELGAEGDVGQASGVHLHFEVAVPDDPSDPITEGGFIIGENRDPRICGIPGNTFVSGQIYTADDC